MTRVLVIGATGMLGNAAFRFFAASATMEVFGTTRGDGSVLGPEFADRLVTGFDATDPEAVANVLERTGADVVMNCVGVVKQLADANDPLVAIPVNSVLPHQLARSCAQAGARLVHMSTDCVFSGEKGNYVESDIPDANDLYGRSKLLGEVDYPNAITLRTSIIGHELRSMSSLIGWFLSQEGEVAGFTNAIFSGLPTVEIARVVRDLIIPRADLSGVWHVSAEPIDKFSLLELVRDAYGKNIQIRAVDEPHIDRSLDSSRFRMATGFIPDPWPKLVETMRDFG